MTSASFPALIVAASKEGGCVPVLPPAISFEDAAMVLRNLMTRCTEREAYETLLETELQYYGLCQEVRSADWLRDLNWDRLVTEGASKALSREMLAALLTSSSALLSLQELLQDLWFRLDAGESVDLAAEWLELFESLQPSVDHTLKENTPLVLGKPQYAVIDSVSVGIPFQILSPALCPVSADDWAVAREQAPIDHARAIGSRGPSPDVIASEVLPGRCDDNDARALKIVRSTVASTAAPLSRSLSSPDLSYFASRVFEVSDSFRREPRHVRWLFNVRRELGSIAASAFERLSCSELCLVVDAMQRATERMRRSSSDKEWLDYDRLFHELFELSHADDRVTPDIDGLFEHYENTSNSIKDATDRRDVVQEHEDVIDAFRQRRFPAAQKALCQHLSKAFERRFRGIFERIAAANARWFTEMRGGDSLDLGLTDQAPIEAYIGPARSAAIKAIHDGALLRYYCQSLSLVREWQAAHITITEDAAYSIDHIRSSFEAFRKQAIREIGTLRADARTWVDEHLQLIIVRHRALANLVGPGRTRGLFVYHGRGSVLTQRPLLGGGAAWDMIEPVGGKDDGLLFLATLKGAVANALRRSDGCERATETPNAQLLKCQEDLGALQLELHENAYEWVFTS